MVNENKKKKKHYSLGQKEAKWKPEVDFEDLQETLISKILGINYNTSTETTSY